MNEETHQTKRCERYHNDPEHRQRVLANNKMYQDKKKMMKATAETYTTDALYEPGYNYSNPADTQDENIVL